MEDEMRHCPQVLLTAGLFGVQVLRCSVGHRQRRDKRALGHLIFSHHFGCSTPVEVREYKRQKKEDPGRRRGQKQVKARLRGLVPTP